MIKKFLTIFLLFFIAVALTSGCSPIGSLLVDSSVGAVQDYIKAVPKRYLYEQGEQFIPEEAMLVTGFFDGKKQDIDIYDKNLVIKIIVPDYSSNPVPADVDKEDGFPLEIVEIYTVIISYRDMKIDYPIQVVEKGKLPPDGDEKNHGIQIIWN